MNSVSSVAWINALREYEARRLKAFTRAVHTCVRRCVRTIVRRGDWPEADEAADRLDVENDVEGMVVEISV
jgi:hypothetical protein